MPLSDPADAAARARREAGLPAPDRRNRPVIACQSPDCPHLGPWMPLPYCPQHHRQAVDQLREAVAAEQYVQAQAEFEATRRRSDAAWPF